MRAIRNYKGGVFPERGATFVEYVFGLALLFLVLAVFGDILLRAVQSDYERKETSLNYITRQPLFTPNP